MAREQDVRLVCFAHAGAGTSAFHRWGELLGPGVNPQPQLLPGRDGRRREPRVTTREALLDDLRELFKEQPPGPYVLYGHSLGGLIAYTLTRALHEAGLPLPALLVTGAVPPPHAVGGVAFAADAPDDELVRVLEGFDGVPPGVAPDVWHRFVLPVLRDDLRLAAALRAAALDPATGGPVPVPLLAVAGEEDPVGPPEVLRGWSDWTTAGFESRTVPGGHFFVRDGELPRLLGQACRTVGRSGR
ncbi:thioesterase II family protein [Streptomyces subrutilus]|uniref:Thioesterase n=1 Tax=Streptomyces subrutilus TaxID=36818 RepID=A0A1E5P083_9ACTN|nr:alpha/beta fold hydrolase [Streptomyces subrutilus]OEJ22416.1 thioesterase [Streptomyces subrutilus]